MVKPRKPPLRKCTGCGEMKNKNDLIRVVRSDAGEFSLDYTGKTSGRGAYVCHHSDCLKKARKCKGLERSFKAAIPAEVYDRLEMEITENIHG